LLIVVAAALRFAGLGNQSFWWDEALTGREVRSGFGDLFGTYLMHVEANPPVYPVAAWLWGHLFGTSDFALRSLSAAAGIATVVVLYVLLAEFVSRRAAVIGGALATVSPIMIWYSQEARAYALVLFLVALSLLFLMRSLERRRRRDLIAWAIVAALASATHYFAIFAVVAEGALLLHSFGWSRAAAAVFGGLATLALGLALLANAQRSEASTSFIADENLHMRASVTARALLAGPVGRQDLRGVLLAELLIVLAALLLVTRTRARDRTRGLVFGAIAASVVLLPLLAGAVGYDYWYWRNLVLAMPPLLAAIAVGFGARGAGVVGSLGAIALCGVFVGHFVNVATDDTARRENWKGGAGALGKTTDWRVVAATPTHGTDSRYLALGLEYYLPSSSPLGPVSSPKVDEIDWVSTLGESFDAFKAPAGFRRVATHSGPGLTVVRFRARTPRAVRLGDLQALHPSGEVGALLQRG
jgi:4-amino-4-deoxy-L-arabinose transferase-like glycosyltransferase